MTTPSVCAIEGCPEAPTRMVGIMMEEWGHPVEQFVHVCTFHHSVMLTLPTERTRGIDALKRLFTTLDRAMPQWRIYLTTADERHIARGVPGVLTIHERSK